MLMMCCYRAKQVEEGKIPGRSEIDGLNSIKYHIKNIELRKTFTSILVDFDPKEVSLRSTVEHKWKKQFQVDISSKIIIKLYGNEYSAFVFLVGTQSCRC